MFTTYNIATGVMFKAMKKQIKVNPNAQIPEMKSRNGMLTGQNKEELLRMIKVAYN
jgi:MoaA/NifB/PqqE/SkfB family radical SAM enzyme